MKKLTLMFVAALMASLSPAWAAGTCTVRHVQGSPVLIRNGQELPLQAGDSLQNGDRVETRTPECRVDWSMNDLAGCRVLPGSKVDMAQSDGPDMAVRVLDGNIILNLKALPADSKFKVETPTAIAAVRGTQFWGRVKPGRPYGGSEEGMTSDITTFAVRKGAVKISYKETGETFDLEEGQAIDLKSGGYTTQVREALEAEMQAMQQADLIPVSG